MKLTEVQTACGKIMGQVLEGARVFRGIPYAKAQRWQHAAELTTFESEKIDAFEFGPAAIQRRTFIPEEADSFYYHEFREGLTFEYQEDCQFLNIWAPKEENPKVKYPVILYIHGGAFQGGCGNEKPFDGTHFAKRGVIFVTCNYRLGPLGFAVRKDKDGQLLANFGLSDQVAALKWLYHNIESFGGDSKNITLMGQSAGAMSIQQHCHSFEAKPYFAKAIMTSGGGYGKSFAKPILAKDAYLVWQEIDQKLGKKADKVPPKVIFDTLAEVLKDRRDAIDFISPVVDNQFVADTPEYLEQAQLEADIPYLLGTTKDDMLADVLFTMASQWVNRRNQDHPYSAYQFYFAHNLPGDDKGAWHSSELWYTIGNFRKSWRPMTVWDEKISNQLMDYICHFVTSGNPNGEGLPIWSNELKNQVLEINDETMYTIIKK